MSKVTLDYDSKQIMRIERKFADVIDKHIPEAAKRSLQDGQKKANTEVVRLVRSFYDPRRVKRGEIIELLQKNTKISLTTNDVDKMFVNIRMPNKSFGLLRFVVGRKRPRKQKGVAIKDRVKLRVKIRTGNETELPHAFIAKAKGRSKDGKQNYQVFSRARSGKLRRMATPSIATYVAKFINPLIRPAVEKKMQQTFVRNLRLLSKLF